MDSWYSSQTNLLSRQEGLTPYGAAAGLAVD